MTKLLQAIMTDPANRDYTKKGIEPLYAAPQTARIVIVGQAPGIVAQETRLYWNDRSGVRLRAWLGVDDRTFYQSGLFGVLPMDFYYPGKGKSGDLPPRKGFAAKWHGPLMALMPHVKLVVLVGQYAQQYYLGKGCRRNLTETVQHFEDYLPDYFPLVHPSPRNQLWLAKNAWFEEELIPVLKDKVRQILRD
ncbi:TPA: uracil-DNA glycosylase family protein [Streptococcus equi subsp. zooepidemicus]|uniref:Uracil-DNA glycosylase family protein n=1 Tax=Streptococcus equi subsp. ruminatorum TaxID=254358 RepID=A0A6M1L1D2_9STRE|nr:uracil-DNA glycosylase family protein [Streptococcus equi]MCD3376386.1 uracil-DNA glycosylase family protein [Streptococcus equi subsp. zooepidemicus]NGL84774.1 uracil-DNA glycosylase family protein [Streptococcus equi subsp. ruminatorum]WOK56700.1 uracil-DNA glycosylase family protein [Streptococcus equi subsp. zooepidemicus]HEL1075607.1 uracil-DNA glycosylase family protein [Streptococcus equi subsp. zooepidemicus]